MRGEIVLVDKMLLICDRNSQFPGAEESMPRSILTRSDLPHTPVLTLEVVMMAMPPTAVALPESLGVSAVDSQTSSPPLDSDKFFLERGPHLILNTLIWWFVTS